jgi:hypothetical protein
MEKLIEDRRRKSYSGLLDSSIQAAIKLAGLPDPMVKVLANQIITDLKQIRREIPARRKFDIEPPRRDT